MLMIYLKGKVTPRHHTCIAKEVPFTNKHSNDKSNDDTSYKK